MNLTLFLSAAVNPSIYGCPEGYYQTGLWCHECPLYKSQPCLKCENEYYCLEYYPSAKKCDEYYFYTEQQLCNYCPEITRIEMCSKCTQTHCLVYTAYGSSCKEGFYLEGNKCHSCEMLFSGCSSCNASECFEFDGNCEPPFELFESQCLNCAMQSCTIAKQYSILNTSIIVFFCLFAFLSLAFLICLKVFTLYSEKARNAAATAKRRNDKPPILPIVPAKHSLEQILGQNEHKMIDIEEVEVKVSNLPQQHSNIKLLDAIDNSTIEKFQIKDNINFDNSSIENVSVQFNTPSFLERFTEEYEAQSNNGQESPSIVQQLARKIKQKSNLL